MIFTPAPLVALDVVNHKLYVVGHPAYLSMGGPLPAMHDLTWQIASYHDGWTGDRSVPTILAFGYRSAISMAQIPVPVPRSSIRWGLNSGARCNCSPHSRTITWCLISRRSSSVCDDEPVRSICLHKKPGLPWMRLLSCNLRRRTSSFGKG